MRCGGYGGTILRRIERCGPFWAHWLMTQSRFCCAAHSLSPLMATANTSFLIARFAFTENTAEVKDETAVGGESGSH